ncbi:hypothetical protein CR513_31512, partial [Mucuna pruriens]
DVLKIVKVRIQDLGEGVDKVKKVKLQSFLKKYESLFMNDQEIIILINSMKACSEKFLNQQIVDKILRTLTSLSNHIVVTIEEPKDLEKMKVEELQNSLETHEQRFNKRHNGEKVQEQALYAQTSHKNKSVSGWNKKGKDKWRGERSGRVVECIGDKGGKGKSNGEAYRAQDEGVKNKVKFVENSIISVNGIEKVVIKREDEKLAYMIDVLKTPLSKNRIFKVNLSVAEMQCFSTTNVKDERWYYILGHLNFKNLNQIKLKKMVLKLLSINLPNMVPCEQETKECFQILYTILSKTIIGNEKIEMFLVFMRLCALAEW